MNLPPQLSTELEQLRSEGYVIEVLEEKSVFCIVFKDYPLPQGVWNREKTDLLIRVQPVYPNGKLDMFWVNPEILLKNGNKPKAGDVIENYCGKQWQRFSWHVQKWNPAIDSILTYLQVVNHRLGLSQ